MNHRYRSFISIVGACLALIILASGISLRGVSGANNNDQITQTEAVASHPRAVRVINANLGRGQRGAVTIELDAQGNENALSFSLNFDPAQLQFVSAAAGSGVTGALLNVNSSQAASGRVGLALALPAGQVIAAGSRSILVVTFDAPSSGSAASTRISFGDQPIRREISDTRANLLPADYFSGVVTFTSSVPSTPEQEPNQTPAQANLLTIPGGRTGSAAVGDASSIIIFYDNGDRDGIEDLFFFDLTNSAQVRLTLTAANKSADLDLFLLTISGIRVTVIKLANGPRSDEQIVSPTLAPGRYYVGVSAARGSSAYTLTATRVGEASCIATVPSDRWKGEYFNNKDLSGAPAMVRDDGNGFLNFNFGTGSPSSDCGIGADNFSARWTRTVNFAAGVHRFTVTVDDGVRLYVDDALKLDKWFDQPTTTYTVDVSLTAGNHSIKLEFYENTELAVAQLSWELLSACVATVAPSNWKGEYFNNKDLSGAPAMVRNDGAGFIDFDFGTDSPSSACGIGVDNFSARWTRTVNFSSAGNYRFTVTADDGVRLFVDNQLLLDKWFDQPATTYPVDVSLTAGDHILRLEYFESGGAAVAKLSWAVVGALATNQSTITSCAEEDNVNIPLTGQVASFIIEATHPTYPVAPDNCAPDFSNCSPALSGFSFTPGVFKLFDDGETVVEAVREAAWWRPNGMTAAVDDQAPTPDAHYIRIYRRIADTSEYPQVLVLYQDGNLRLIPQPPVGTSSVCFGGSVIIGPAAPAQRPIAEIASITYVSQSQSLEIKYRDGGSAAIILRDVNRNLTRVRVNVNYSTGALPFATFRSMFVADGNADVDYVKWVDAAGVTRNDPILTFPGGEGTEWFFDRQTRSRHNTSAPGLRIRIE